MWKAHVKREAPEFFCSVSPLFWLYKYNSLFGEQFRDDQYSLVTLVFVLLLLVPPRTQSFVTVGARAPVPYGWNRRQLHTKKHYKTAIQSKFCTARQCKLSPADVSGLLTPVNWLFPASGRATATAVSPSSDRVRGTVVLLNSEHQTLGWTCSDAN